MLKCWSSLSGKSGELTDSTTLLLARLWCYGRLEPVWSLVALQPLAEVHLVHYNAFAVKIAGCKPRLALPCDLN